MASGEDRDPTRKTPPGLLILTGASHTGKTSVARELLRLVPPPAAFLSIDDILTTVVARPPGDIWEQIPLAYTLLRCQAKALLDRSWLVIVESTFTYIPESGEPEFHAHDLEQLVQIAEKRSVRWQVAQLKTTMEDAASRAETTDRLPNDKVVQTIMLHESAPLPANTLAISSEAETPEAIAQRLFDLFCAAR